MICVEIIIQLYGANKVCRIKGIFPIENILFMGLGEPADNVGPTRRAAANLVDPALFALSTRRVTISTVTSPPDAFHERGQSETVLAWSVNAANDELRTQLVPTTRYSMAELSNDSEEAGLELAQFCRPLLEKVTNIKLVVNLIPWNDISADFGPAATYRKPSPERVLRFQEILIAHGITCYVRTTRGDEENSACGMLSTKKTKASP